MKIVDVQVIPFRVTVDGFRNREVLPPREAVQTLTRIVTDDGAEGYYLGGQGHGDRDGLPPDSQARLVSWARSWLVGQDPFDRTKFWHWMWAAKLPENLLSCLDLALWDLQGRALGVPIHKLLGGCRDRVKAYASTYPNMGAPDEYAAHALYCKEQGYRAYKLHPYYFADPVTFQPLPGRPSHVEMDIAACRAAREAVGDDMVLMFDPWGTYHTYRDALRVGRALEELGFYWYEHPMPEDRVHSYEQLCQDLEIPILSPEIVYGSLYSRADWIRRDASDISRIDVLRGGITGCIKLAAICEAYGLRCEMHMSGFGNLQILGATSEDTCEYYERGLLAPGIDVETPPPYLEEIADPLDSEGYVRVPQEPGMGYRLVWDYIEANRIREQG